MANSARIDELRKKFDENPRRYFAPLANEYRKAGDLEQAIFICQEYLPQQPGHMSGHIVYGQALFEMGRMDEAQIVFETALSLDPENLIALRHLGDISRSTGDLNGARIWYQRVLEADPRNEEIAQIMLELLATPAAPVDPRAFTPRTSSPAIEYEPQARAEVEPAPPADAGPGFTVEKSEDSALPAPPQAADRPAPPAPAPALPQPPHVDQGTKAIDGHDFLDLNDFNLGGVPLRAIQPAEPQAADHAADRAEPAWHDAPASAPILEDELFVETPITAPANYLLPEELPAELRAEPAAHTSAADDAAVGAEQPAMPSEPEESGHFNLGQEDGPFELDPFAIAAGSAPPIELAADLHLGLPDDGTSPDMTSEDPPLIDGLETFEAGVIEHIVDEAPSIEAAGFFDADGISDPADDTANAEDTESAAAAPAFVTETMAELYLEQGHLESALHIYTQLVEQRPGDDRLRERLDAVEQRVYGKPAASATVESEAPAVPSYGGPTIREFLSALVARRDVYVADIVADVVADIPDERGETATATDQTPYVPETSIIDFGSAMAGTARHTPSSSETVSGSIDALFSGADASSSDVAAASTLQEAFAPDTADTTPLQGIPAHRASSELSLDHVFRGNAPPPADADGFSFDQFFAEEMSAPAAGVPGEGSAPAEETTDDIAQFNAWLNGLKKT